MTPETAPAEVAILETTVGDLVIAFWSEVAPNTVLNFKKLARQGFYDGTCFHRIVKGFMVQGGDPLTKDPAAKDRFGTGGPGYTLKAEFNARSHVRGVISMARSAHPDSAGSQFFICLGDARFLDRQYTAFGELIRGDAALERMGNTPVARGAGGEQSQPTVRIELRQVRIVPADSLPPRAVGPAGGVF